MSQHDPSSTAPATLARDEARGLRWLLTVGAVLVAAVCAIEWHTGLINPWDRVLLPALSAVLAAFAARLWWRPQTDGRLRLAAVITFNAYLVASLLLTLFALGGTPNLYQFLTTAYWLPLGYGIAFVFLPPRTASVVSVAMYATLALPIGLWIVRGGAAGWGDDFGVLAAVLGAAQIAYIVLLAAVATLRAGYYRTEERMRIIETLATTDPLTGLPNRRAMVDALAGVMSQVQRHGQPAVVMLIDIDHFKRINDRHGHAVGDAALVHMGRLLKAQLRPSDRVGRWGGEEFLVVAAATALPAGVDLAERLRGTVAAHPFDHGEPVTVSLGVTQVLPGDDADSLLARADRALYRAKGAGRNRAEAARATPAAVAG